MLHVRVSIVRETKSSPSPEQIPSSARRSWRRPAALASVMTLVAVALVGSAGAAPTTGSTAVAFVDITPKQVWGNNSISPNRGESVVVIGGSTTVPSNATTVRLAVTVKGTAAGTIKLFPAGNEAGGGHIVSWSAGGTNTATVAENIGLSNKITVFNNSTKAAVVTIKITGYSTQVTANDINGFGGTAGQVLTNNGAGGATWEVPSLPATYTARTGEDIKVSNSTPTTLTSLTLPAGAYKVEAVVNTNNFEGDATTLKSSYLCLLDLQRGPGLASEYGNLNSSVVFGTIALQSVFETSGGNTVSILCQQYNGSGEVHVNSSTLIATRVRPVTGAISAP